MGIASVNEHYDNLLARRYVWAFGTYEENAVRFKDVLARVGLAPGAGTRALDLGCGPGYQALALADLGATVTAVDTSPVLLQHLEQRRGQLPIRTIPGDIMLFPELCPGLVDLVLCLGDVLAHLPEPACVPDLFAKIFKVLAPGGTFLLGFRDKTLEVHGADRVIPGPADADRIMTTFLEFEPDFLTVTDVIHERIPEGWSVHKSAYRKLRLRTDPVQDLLRHAGFKVTRCEVTGGFTYVLAGKV